MTEVSARKVPVLTSLRIENGERSGLFAAALRHVRAIETDLDMPSISVISYATTGLVDAFRANLLRRANEHRADLRVQDLAITETLGSPRGRATQVGELEHQSDLRPVNGADSARAPAESVAIVARSVSGSAAPFATQTPLPSSTTGNTISSDPLRVLNGQTLPIPRDAADAVTLFLQSTGRRLTDSVADSTTVDGGTTESVRLFDDLPNDRAGLAQSLLRPDLHTPLNSQIPISAANVSPEVFPTPLDVSGSSAVVPALAGTALMHINSGESAFRGNAGPGNRSVAARSEELNRRRTHRPTS
jgi:hypothetical protein